MSNSLDIFHPLIKTWFLERVGRPTDVQTRAWPEIAAERHVLATAPTGSGKTLAAFLWAIDRLVTGTWPRGGVRVVYVSPLKALNNDVHRNLLKPLEELETVFREHGAPFPPIKVHTRSGDTPAEERSRMLRRPPDVLITTPESLNLILSSPKARRVLDEVRTVILDEVHAVAGSKRGTHLITAVDRLVLQAGDFQRIALSATVKPLDAVAKWVGGYVLEEAVNGPIYRKRPVRIVQSRDAKRYAVTVRYPIEDDKRAEDASPWPHVARAIREIVRANRSTLIFTNARRTCERLTLHINQDQDNPPAYAHHGSLSRETRAAVEQRLKDGRLAAIVATSSLELGIDIGALDQVLLVQTPMSVASALQRIGRAGHSVGAVSRGTLFPIHPRDILNAAVMARAVLEQDIEELRPIQAPLDVLAQVITSMAGLDTWRVDDLYNVLRTSAPYHALTRRQFDRVLEMLAGRYADSRIRALQPIVSLDRRDGTVRGRPGTLPLIYGSGGTIPDRGYFAMRLKDSNEKIGELDEEFVWERYLGDRFLLGTQTWKILQITHNDVIVAPSPPQRDILPFWRAEPLTRPHHFSERIAEFLEDADRKRKQRDFSEELQTKYHLEGPAADALIEFLQRQREATGAPLPHRHHVLIEYCADHRRAGDHAQVMVHTLWGRALNLPFALALAQAWHEQTGQRADAFADNDAVVLTLPDRDERIDVFGLVDPRHLEELLRKRLESTGFFGARFRENAARALLLPKQAFGKRSPLWVSRLRSKKLLEAVAKYEDFPILAETWRACLQDEFDMENLRRLLGEVRLGLIKTTEVVTSRPSPFAEAIVWQQTNEYMYASDEPDAHVISRLRDDIMTEAVFSETLRPMLDPAQVSAFQRKAQRTFPEYSPRSVDELVDWLKERLFIPDSEWVELIEAIKRDHGLDPAELERATTGKSIQIPGGRIHLDAQTRYDQAVRPGDEGDAALAQWLAEWLRFYGPIRKQRVLALAPFGSDRVLAALDALLEDRTLIEGLLTRDAAAPEVCDAENLEILLRLSRAAARPALEPLPLRRLPLFLAAWQGIAREDGPHDFDKILDQLAGLPMPPELLEKEVLPARIPGYRREMLDEAFRDGGLVWFGAGQKRIALGSRWALDLFIENPQENLERTSKLFPNPLGRYDFSTLLDHTGLTTKELTDRLWQSVWAGETSNDAFDALRKGVESGFKAKSVEGAPGPLRRGPQHGRARARFRAWKTAAPFTGHWFVLPRTAPPEDPLDELELRKDRARGLFDRYGILFRDLLRDEPPPLRWGAVFRALRLMELAGEVLAGHFFAGVDGLQFASPDALKRLQRGLPEDAVYWLCAADPASLCGLGPAGRAGLGLPKRLKGTHLVFRGAEIVLVSSRSGKELDIRVPPGDPRLDDYYAVLDHLLARAFQPFNALDIETINRAPAPSSPYLDSLRRRFDLIADHKKLTLYRKTP